jgi:hypothetical protein
MAASPIALLPVIRTLVTIHLNGYFRTNNGAHSAASAFAVTVKRCRRVTGSVKLADYRDDLLGTERHAEFTAFA